MKRKHYITQIIVTISGVLLVLFLSLLPACNSVEPDINSSLDNKNVGVLSGDLLAGSRFNKLIIELLLVKGYEPSDSAINNLRQWLDTIINKPSGIEIVKTYITSPNLPHYNINEVRLIESYNRTQKTSGKTMAISVFFSDEKYAEDTTGNKTLGIAYANTSIVIFQKTINSMSGNLLQPGRVMLENTVMYHEFGHLMGLVNLGAKMQTPHRDVLHSSHCDNEDCLMYWEIETGSFAEKLFGLGKIPKLDANCRKDLKAHGGR